MCTYPFPLSSMCVCVTIQPPSPIASSFHAVCDAHSTSHTPPLIESGPQIQNMDYREKWARQREGYIPFSIHVVHSTRHTPCLFHPYFVWCPFIQPYPFSLINVVHVPIGPAASLLCVINGLYGLIQRWLLLAEWAHLKSMDDRERYDQLNRINTRGWLNGDHKHNMDERKLQLVEWWPYKQHGWQTEGYGQLNWLNTRTHNIDDGEKYSWFNANHMHNTDDIDMGYCWMNGSHTQHGYLREGVRLTEWEPHTTWMKEKKGYSWLNGHTHMGDRGKGCGCQNGDRAQNIDYRKKGYGRLNGNTQSMDGR